jgi:hypothetical protein
MPEEKGLIPTDLKGKRPLRYEAASLLFIVY